MESSANITVIGTSEAAQPVLFTVDDRENTADKDLIKRQLIIMAVIYGIGFIILPVIGINIGDFKNILPSAAILLVMLVIQLTDLMEKRGGDETYNSFLFYEDCYSNFDRLSKTTIPYSMVVKAVETKELIFIYMEHGKAHIIKKDRITHGTAEQLSAFLQARIHNYRIIMRKGRKL